MTSTTQTMQAARTTGNPDAPIALTDVAAPVPEPNEALVRVHATSLNAGELRQARNKGPGQPIGWDFAGTVEQPAADGTGPRAGKRVAGLLPGGAWAQYIAAPVYTLAGLPDAVSFNDAATLPVAGVTALRTLRHGGELRGKSVLIVPGTGGVGLLALQLARRAGANVTTVIRSAANEPLVRGHGAQTVFVGPTADAGRDAKYDLILESLGGESLGAALGMLRPEGTVVSFGQTIGGSTTFASNVFYATGGATLYGFFLFYEAAKMPVAADLEFLAGLVAAGDLVTNIDATQPFANLTDCVSMRADRKLTGKIIVTFPER